MFPRVQPQLTRILTILSIMALCLGIVSVAQAQEGVAPHPPVNVQAATDERVTSTNVKQFPGDRLPHRAL